MAKDIGIEAAAIAAEGLVIAIGLITSALARRAGCVPGVLEDLQTSLRVLQSAKRSQGKHQIAQNALSEVLRLLETVQAPPKATPARGH